VESSDACLIPNLLIHGGIFSDKQCSSLYILTESKPEFYMNNSLVSSNLQHGLFLENLRNYIIVNASTITYNGYGAGIRIYSGAGRPVILKSDSKKFPCSKCQTPSKRRTDKHARQQRPPRSPPSRHVDVAATRRPCQERTLKVRQMRERKTRHHTACHENARNENAAPKRRGENEQNVA